MQILGYQWNGRKVLVTGASGFKGSWLCAALVHLGARVHGTVQRAKCAQAAYSVLRLEQKIVSHSVDVTDAAATHNLVKSVEPEVIFHLAAVSNVPAAIADPRKAYEVNFLGTLNVLEACRHTKSCKRLIYCSSDHVFGSGHDLPARGREETSRLHYGGPYDTSKTVAELVVRSHHQSYWAELPAIAITRAANVIGFGDVNQRRVAPEFVRSALTEKKICIQTPGTGRQFIHVTDSTAGYLRAASWLDEESDAKLAGLRPDSREPFTPTFHFAIEKFEGTEKPYITIGLLAEQVARQFRATVDRSKVVECRTNENKFQALNCDRTRELLAWRVRKPLGEALKELGEYQLAANSPPRLDQLLERDLTALIAAAEPAGVRQPMTPPAADRKPLAA